MAVETYAVRKRRLTRVLGNSGPRGRALAQRLLRLVLRVRPVHHARGSVPSGKHIGYGISAPVRLQAGGVSSQVWRGPAEWHRLRETELSIPTERVTHVITENLHDKPFSEQRSYEGRERSLIRETGGNEREREKDRTNENQLCSLVATLGGSVCLRRLKFPVTPLSLTASLHT